MWLLIFNRDGENDMLGPWTKMAFTCRGAMTDGETRSEKYSFHQRVCLPRHCEETVMQSHLSPDHEIPLSTKQQAMAPSRGHAEKDKQPQEKRVLKIV